MTHKRLEVTEMNRFLLAVLLAGVGHSSAFCPSPAIPLRAARSRSHRSAVLELSARFVGEKSKLHTEVLGANEQYASTFGAKADLPLPPGRSAAFVVCMDARINPAGEKAEASVEFTSCSLKTLASPRDSAIGLRLILWLVCSGSGAQRG